jgi:hypothetical protein
MLRGMKVYILGLDHAIQNYEDPRSDAAARKNLETLLREIIQKATVQFIGEETFRDISTVARCLAVPMDIRWEAIEMSTKAREELGIAEEQTKQRTEITVTENGVRPVNQRVLSDEIREAYMLWRVLTAGRRAQSVLVLCGFSHAEPLRQRFENHGHHVTLDSLCNHAWYSHPDCEQFKDLNPQPALGDAKL